MFVCQVILTAALVVAASCACAEITAPDPTTDLSAMEQKAATSPQARQFLTMARELGSRREDQVRVMLMERIGGRNRDFDATIDIASAGQIGRSVVRGQYIGQILSADLNGDWSVTLVELQNALQLQPLNGAAEVFVLSDLNSDGILSTEEIRAGADKMAANREGRRDRSAEILALFDFSNDGLVTPDEIQRGLNALAPKS